MIRKTVLACTALLLLWSGAEGAEPAMKAHFIDVGQGACTLLEFPCGAVLIDTGGQDEQHTDHLADFLSDFFRRRSDLNNTLNVVFVSHPHIDHTMGIRRVFSTCRVAHYVDDGIVSGSGRAGAKWVRDQDSHNHTTIVRPVEDDEITSLHGKHGLSDDKIDPISCPDCDPQIRVLSGGFTENPGWNDGDFDNLNNQSIVVRVDFGESSFLFTGDLQEAAIDTLLDYYSGTDLLDVDVYLVGHHGSHNATTQPLLDAMTPELAVIGVGKPEFGEGLPRGFNTFSYGHPRRSIIDLLSAAIPGDRSPAIDVRVADAAREFSSYHVSKQIYATAWDGDVTVNATLGGEITVASNAAAPMLVMRSPPAAPVHARAIAARPAALSAPPSGRLRSSQEPYRWNLQIPEKRPREGGNGKLVMFDASHGGAVGESDWVIDGGFSDFADALAKAGYVVREYRGIDKDGDGYIRFLDDRRPEFAERNEAVIELSAINEADVFIMAETNRPLTQSERSDLLRFIESGKGLFLISDHYNADRNLNSWDATEVFNGYNRSTAQQFNLGGLYGDLRNPGDPTKGWLAENFGLRFRFNAINCLNGASEILPPRDGDQITDGVEPILMAAGATLAIVDPSRAKGLVYLSTSDRASSWPKAVEGEDGGLYFGGRDEGPLVAISKPNKGKAAFIGDSSPIEDKSPRYRDDRNGEKKRLHDGWNDRGSAKVLCVNIVNWLAHSEPFVGFDGSNGHSPGIATPTPMTEAEFDDPDDGAPWSRWPGHYDPWNTDTFAPGSYNAPFAVADSRASEGEASGASVDVATALNSPDGSRLQVEGVIIGELNDQFGLKLADSMTASSFLSVQIPKDLRAQFSPKLAPSIVGKKVQIVAKRGKYSGLPGLRAITSIQLVDGS